MCFRSPKNGLIQAASNALWWVVSIVVGALAESYSQGRNDVQPLAFLQLVSQWGIWCYTVSTAHRLTEIRQRGDLVRDKRSISGNPDRGWYYIKCRLLVL